LDNDNNFIIANFEGKVMGTRTGGHYSVIAAYNESEDSVLILDAAAHKNPWFWVPIRHLYLAMRTKNKEGRRGYLIISESSAGSGSLT